MVLAADSCGDTNRVCVLDSNISADQNWVDGNTYVLKEDLFVLGTGTDLNIAPGAVIKALPGKSLILAQGARISALGSAQRRIVFTSCRDQNVFVDAQNADTSSIPGCAGAPYGGDYNTAIWIRSDAGMRMDDSVGFLRILFSRYGVRVDGNLGSVHDANFAFLRGSVAAPDASAVFLAGARDTNVFRSVFDRTLDASGIRTDDVYAGAVFDNNFTGTGYANAAAIYASGVFTGKVFRNRFAVPEGESGAGTYFYTSATGLFSGSVFDNVFDRGTTYGVLIGPGDGNVFNNLFSSGFAYAVYSVGESGAGVFNNTFLGASLAVIRSEFGSFGGRVESNLFVRSPSGLLGSFTGVISHNAFFEVGAPGGSDADHVGDVNADSGLVIDPFVGTGSDRNFLLNADPAGGALLVDAGSVSTDAFFSDRTTQASGARDTGAVDIGFHYPRIGLMQVPDQTPFSDSERGTWAGTGFPTSGSPGGGVLCGNGFCDGAENARSCSVDCGPVCGDQICSHFESSASCANDCVGSCGNRTCDVFESAFSCPADCAPYVPVVVSRSESTVSEVSPSGGSSLFFLIQTFDWLDPARVTRAAAAVSVRRRFVIETLSLGSVMYKQTRVILEVTNRSGGALTDVNILEILPSRGVDASRIRSDFPFVRIEGGKALLFVIPGILADQTVTLDYVVPGVLSAQTQEEFGAPFSSGVEPSTPQAVARLQCVSNADCGSDDACAVSRCVQNLCYALFLPDGESCGMGFVCRANACVRVIRPLPPQALDPLVVVSVVVIVLAVAGIGFEYLRPER
jgi:hypothetical protein